MEDEWELSRAGSEGWLLCDSYYQEVYPAEISAASGLYGREGLDPITPHVDLPRRAPLRVAHRALPAYVARALRHLAAIAAATAELVGTDEYVLFRGQPQQYLLPRTDAVRRMLFGNALRPRRQRALMSFDGWGWHANIVTQGLKAAAYLHPEFVPDVRLDGAHLFPSRDDDAFYDWLLERQEASDAKPHSPMHELYRHLPRVAGG